jgi:hypothetical protein
MNTFANRNPTDDEIFLALAAALLRLGGPDAENTVQEQMRNGASFESAARGIGVKVDDLVDAFCEEMLALGFIIGRRWIQ